MKRTAIKRGTKQLKRTPFKRVQSKTKKIATPLATLRKKADSLLTPLAKKLSPECECCGMPTQVGHHWIEKSRSSFLRYDLRNIISLCNTCHAKIHNRFGNSVVGGYDVASIIVSHRGIVWKETMDTESQMSIKTDRDFYTTNFNRLQTLLLSI